MSRIVISFVALCILLGQLPVMGQDDSAHEHLKPLESVIGEWEAEFEVPPGHPEVGEEGEKVVQTVSWRWMLKKSYIVMNLKRQVGNKTQVGREIVGWDAKSGQLVHWIFWDGGFHGKGEWSIDGNHWTLRWSASGPDKKVVKGTSHLVMVDDDTMTWRATDITLDGEAQADFPTVTRKRKKE